MLFSFEFQPLIWQTSQPLFCFQLHSVSAPLFLLFFFNSFFSHTLFWSIIHSLVHTTHKPLLILNIKQNPFSLESRNSAWSLFDSSQMSLTPCIQDTRTKIPRATTSEVRSGPLSSNESSAGLFAFRHMDRPIVFPCWGAISQQYELWTCGINSDPQWWNGWEEWRG